MSSVECPMFAASHDAAQHGTVFHSGKLATACNVLISGINPCFILQHINCNLDCRSKYDLMSVGKVAQPGCSSCSPVSPELKLLSIVAHMTNACPA